MERSIFFSYSHKDAVFAQALKAELEKRLGQRVWIDTGELRAGDDFEQRIRDGILRADDFVVLLSPDSVAPTSYVRDELEEAFRVRTPVVPVLIKTIEQGSMPLRLQRKHYTDLRDWKPGAPHAGFDNLVERLGGGV